MDLGRLTREAIQKIPSEFREKTLSHYLSIPLLFAPYPAQAAPSEVPPNAAAGVFLATASAAMFAHYWNSRKVEGYRAAPTILGGIVSGVGAAVAFTVK